MKKILILILLSFLFSCGTKNKTGELQGRFEIVETNCNTDDVRKRIVDFERYDNRIQVKIIQSTALNFSPFSFDGEYRKLSDNNFEIYAEINSYSGLVAYIISGKFKDDKNFSGKWIEKILNNNTSFTCDITGIKIN